MTDVGFGEREEMIAYPYDEAIREVNPKEHGWYQEAVEADGQIIWTEPYEDAHTG